MGKLAIPADFLFSSHAICENYVSICQLLLDAWFGSTVCAGRDIIHGMGAEIVFEEVCNGGEVDEVGKLQYL